VVQPINTETKISKNLFSKFVITEYGPLQSSLPLHVHTTAYTISMIGSMPGIHFLKFHTEQSLLLLLISSRSSKCSTEQVNLVEQKVVTGGKIWKVGWIFHNSDIFLGLKFLYTEQQNVQVYCHNATTINFATSVVFFLNPLL
jgi:hypothetical protein